MKAVALQALRASLRCLFVVQALPELSGLDARFPEICCHILREDVRHPLVSGNKWVKLLPYLAKIQKLGMSEVASCGGAYSNHLHALGWLGYHLGFSTQGVVRGERPDSLNPTLQDLSRWGMKLHFVTREQYRKLRTQPSDAQSIVGDAYWIPEGGADVIGREGVRIFAAQLLRDLPQYDYIVLGCGSGTTLAGLASIMPSTTQILGICAFKGGGYLRDQIHQWLSPFPAWGRASWRLLTEYHFGGFAKMDQRLKAFGASLNGLIELDPVYTMKAFYALCDLLVKGYFPAGSRILFIHTGGLQGARESKYP